VLHDHKRTQQRSEGSVKKLGKRCSKGTEKTITQARELSVRTNTPLSNLTASYQELPNLFFYSLNIHKDKDQLHAPRAHSFSAAKARNRTASKAIIKHPNVRLKCFVIRFTRLAAF
jgi:hypothetical protein